MYPTDFDNIWYFESILKIVRRIHSSLTIILILSMMPKLTTTNFLTSGSVHESLVPGIKYRSKKIHNSTKNTQSSSHIRWLNGEEINISRTISVLVITELNNFNVCLHHEICALMGFYCTEW
jgi:hypothetical protein